MSIPGSLSFASFVDWEPGNKVDILVSQNSDLSGPVA